MFNEGVNFRRKVRVDFMDHRKRVTVKGLGGLGQDATGIEELQYQAPLVVEPSYSGDIATSIIATGAEASWAPAPVVATPTPSLLQSLLGLGNTYLQVQKVKAVASSQQRLATALKPPVTGIGSAIFPGGISSTTIFMGAVLLIGGYFVITSMSGGQKQGA